MQSDWIIGEKIGSGAFGDVYNSNKDFVIKIETCKRLFWEYTIYTSYLTNHPGILKLPRKPYGEKDNYRYLVLPKLDKNLSQITMNPEQVRLFGKEALDILCYVHSKNLVYLDIKPENFMYSGSCLYLIDFGSCVRQNSKFHSGFVGTPLFASLNIHKGLKPKPQDDLISLGYLMIYLINGRLPWQDALSDEEVIRIKRETSLETLCEGTGLTDYMKSINNSNYEYLKSLL